MQNKILFAEYYTFVECVKCYRNIKVKVHAKELSYEFKFNWTLYINYEINFPLK